MNRFFELGNRYAAKSDWTDFALTKFCLCSMGVLIGVSVAPKYKKAAIGIASGVFLATYVPLMAKTAQTAWEMIKEEKE